MRLVAMCSRLGPETSRLLPQRYLLDIAHCLVALGADVQLVSTPMLGTKAPDSIEDFTVHRPAHRSRWPWTVSPEIKQLVQQLNPDLAICIVGIAGLPLGTPVPEAIPVVRIVTSPMYSLRYLLGLGADFLKNNIEDSTVHFMGTAMAWLMERRLARSSRSDMTIVSSDNMAHGLQKVGFPVDRVHVIRPAVGPLFTTQASLVSEDEKARIRATLGLPSSATLLLYLGGTNPMRGADLAINVASALRKRAISNNRLPFGDPRLVILARPATRNYEQKVAALVSQARVLGMEDALVVVSGMLPPSQVRDYIDASDAAILPFRIVPSDAPLAVLECLARGRLVVASALDGVPEMLADGRGIAVPPHDFAAKADSVAGKLASALADRNFLGSLAIQAPAYVHRLHSPSVMAESVSQVFSPALAEAGLRPGRVGEDTR